LGGGGGGVVVTVIIPRFAGFVKDNVTPIYDEGHTVT
jgi:hypothetical protein